MAYDFNLDLATAASRTAYRIAERALIDLESPGMDGTYVGVSDDDASVWCVKKADVGICIYKDDKLVRMMPEGLEQCTMRVIVDRGMGKTLGEWREHITGAFLAVGRPAEQLDVRWSDHGGPKASPCVRLYRDLPDVSRIDMLMDTEE